MKLKLFSLLFFLFSLSAFAGGGIGPGNMIAIGSWAPGDCPESLGSIVFQSAGPCLNSTTAVTSFSAGTTGLTPSSATTGAVTLGGTLGVSNGGTGTSSPSLVAGSNITITGSWPNQTIAASGGGGTPGSPYSSIQFNNSGSFGGSSNFEWNNSSNYLIDLGSEAIGTNTPVNTLDVYGNLAIGTTYAGSSSAPANGLAVVGSVGIGTNTPTNQLSFSGQSAQKIWLERNSTTSGQSLTLQSGGAETGGTNLAGGNLILSSGTSTGTGVSGIQFQIPIGSNVSTTDNPPTTFFTVTGQGASAGALTLTMPNLPSTTGSALAGTPVTFTSGSAQSSASTSGYIFAPNAGDIKVQAGTGGASTSATIYNIGGNGGNASLISGPGGVASGTTANVQNTSGNGGNTNVTAGQGGNATTASSGTSVNTGGTGGGFNFTAGQGGQASNAGTNSGGPGGSGSFTGGAGGAATAGNGGSGGTLNFQSGFGGNSTNSGTAGSAGNIVFITGSPGTGQAGASSGSNGKITFAISSATPSLQISSGKKISVGSGTVAVSLEDVFGNMTIGTNYAGVNAAPTNGMIVVGSVGIGTSSPLSQLAVSNLPSSSPGSGGGYVCADSNGNFYVKSSCP